MANEELVQRGYLTSGTLRGTKFGEFEELNIGATSIADLRTAGLDCTPATTVPFPFKSYKVPKQLRQAKPDRVFADRRQGTLVPVAVAEHKRDKKYKTDKELSVAAEQSLCHAAVLGTRVAAITNGDSYSYIDVASSLNSGSLVFFDEHRSLNPAVLEDLLSGSAAVAKNPQQLAQTVWQIIWHATKEEPKQCLMTFVELFVLKFLSDNLPPSALPKALSFYELAQDPAVFAAQHGKTAISYYVSSIRPHIKTLFPDNTVSGDAAVARLFGLKTVVSKTSVINGFAFLRSSTEPLDSFNRTFLEILEVFQRFGSLRQIDPEFKLRLYETFLKNTPRQQKLGQFFTPRNVVRQMIRMAQLNKLADNSVVLDPAAGVGGFVLEPLLIEEALPQNVRIVSGKPKRRVRTVGVDVDSNTHILAKANMLIHLADLLRDPATTLPALNEAMADTFVLMNSNETLGGLENPPRDAIDVILTNPPYVTQGSAIYRKELAALIGTRNSIIPKDYYEGWGLGVEALFMRYISGALKPGGRAFVIVPLGMLNRTEPKPKISLLKECNILASIELPRNTFFNTSQPTSILVLERRHTEVDPRPSVLCGYVRSIGESLDMYRIPTPDANDLAAVADAFIQRDADDAFVPTSPVVKIVPASDFSELDRWDVARFWSEEELVSLGVKPAAIGRGEFIETAMDSIAELLEELKASKEEIAELTSGPSVSVSLSNSTYFTVRSGTRIRNEDIRSNPGDVPVYSCFKEKAASKGSISEEYLKQAAILLESEEREIVTVIANGAKAVGKVFVRREVCVLTDDVIAVDILSDDIDAEYLATELRRAIASGGFLYEAKLFKGRVEQLTAEIPKKPDGSFDLEAQRNIAAATRRFDLIRDKLHEMGDWSASARIA
ncbi:HsdM family class I SAM-dependent methyltransferase [Luteimonas terrae]|nr:N-6 DNA methylase [Luteimonas terrae]